MVFNIKAIKQFDLEVCLIRNFTDTLKRLNQYFTHKIQQG